MSYRILVIEDNHDIARLVEMHLQDLSYQVDLVVDDRTGLDCAMKGRYDLIILDIMLPGIDGLEICRQLRGAANHTPVLMLTARITELDRLLGLELGADDFLTKPFSIMELLARVKAIIRRAGRMSRSPRTNITKQSQQTGRILLRVVRCLPPAVGLSVHASTQRAGVLHPLTVPVLPSK